MAKLLSRTIQIRSILKSNGLKKGDFTISHKTRKIGRTGKEYGDSYICLRKEILPEVVENIVSDGLSIHLNGKYPIFKW